MIPAEVQGLPERDARRIDQVRRVGAEDPALFVDAVRRRAPEAPVTVIDPGRPLVVVPEAPVTGRGV